MTKRKAPAIPAHDYPPILRDHDPDAIPTVAVKVPQEFGELAVDLGEELPTRFHVYEGTVTVAKSVLGRFLKAVAGAEVVDQAEG